MVPGNYPMLDLQQLHTSLISPSDIAQRILATVVSYYPGRGENGQDEALCDAGAIAMSKDVEDERWTLASDDARLLCFQ